MENRDKTIILLKTGGSVETTETIIFSGDYIVVSSKQSDKMGKTGVVTQRSKPYHLNEIKEIITTHFTKIYEE